MSGQGGWCVWPAAARSVAVVRMWQGQGPLIRGQQDTEAGGHRSWGRSSGAQNPHLAPSMLLWLGPAVDKYLDLEL